MAACELTAIRPELAGKAAPMGSLEERESHPSSAQPPISHALSFIRQCLAHARASAKNPGACSVGWSIEDDSD